VPDARPAPPAPPAPEPPAPPAPEPPAPRTFDQADVDRIVQERLARAKGDPPADYADLKAAAAELAELKKASQTELERAQAERDEAKATAEAATASARQILLRASVLAAASKAGAVDPDDVFALLPTDAVTIGDDGQVTGAEDAVKALLEAKPHLVGKPTTPTGSADGGAQGGPGPTQLTRDDLKTMTPDQITKAKADGQLNDLLGITT
jgi:hypothetical protein